MCEAAQNVDGRLIGVKKNGPDPGFRLLSSNCAVKPSSLLIVYYRV